MFTKNMKTNIVCVMCLGTLCLFNLVKDKTLGPIYAERLCMYVMFNVLEMMHNFKKKSDI